jgi:hypothetical protein
MVSQKIPRKEKIKNQKTHKRKNMKIRQLLKKLRSWYLSAEADSSKNEIPQKERLITDYQNQMAGEFISQELAPHIHSLLRKGKSTYIKIRVTPTRIFISR